MKKQILNWIKMIIAFIMYLIILIQIRQCIDYYKPSDNQEEKIDYQEFYYIDPRQEKIK